MHYTGDKNIDLFLDFLKQNKHQMSPSSADEIENLIQSTKGNYLPKRIS